MKFVLPALLATASTVSALDIAGYSPALHDRFASGFSIAPVPTASPSFLGAGFDLSGIGWNPAFPMQGFAMISDRYFVYAEHFAPGPTISFLTPANTIFTANVSTTLFQATSTTFGTVGDFAVGMLSTPLDPALGITSYPILSLPTFSAYTGLTILVYGHGSTDTDSPRLGTNTIDGIIPTGSPSSNAEQISYSDSGTPTGEAFLISGDSGSPSFVAINGQLALVGTHASTGLRAGVPTSFDSFVPDYLPSLTAHNVNFRTVPEPTTGGLLALGVGALAARRRR